MKYFVRIGAQSLEVEVDGPRVLVGGKALEATLVAVPGTPLRHLLVGGESWTLAADPAEGPGRWALGVAGEWVEVEALDQRAREIQALARKRPGPAAGRTVKAPMPGLVVRIEVAAGQPVAAGTGLVVVEAMKMENELRAPQPGVVATVHVEVGQAVEKGAPPHDKFINYVNFLGANGWVPPNGRQWVDYIRDKGNGWCPVSVARREG